ncbi:MAG: crotonase/enoyl-CoA hydratase family protein [Deltaproteobacteria bacterium]|jgi:enoyl-CoA hydratase
MERITYEVTDHVARIGLNRADKRNAFDPLMLRELAEAYTAFEDDADARCALVYPHGDHFTGGLDLAKVGPEVASGNPLFPEGTVDPLGLGARRRSKPVVIAVRGYCFTLGVELMLACDVAIAGDDTKFTQIEVQRGIYPFGGGTLRFVAQAGWGNAMRWLLTGDIFDAAEAARMNLVQEVVAPDAVIERAELVAGRIAAQAPLAVQATLASARAGVQEGFEAEAARLLDRAKALMGTEDAAEGMMSFLERRAGKFVGR